MSINQLRAEFEACAKTKPFIKDVQRYYDHPIYGNEYGHCDTQNAWEIWQDAIAAKNKNDQNWVRCSERMPTADDADENHWVYVCAPHSTGIVFEVRFDTVLKYAPDSDCLWHAKPKSVKPLSPTWKN